AVEKGPDGEKFAGFVNEVGREASGLSEAMGLGLSLIPRGNPGRLLLLTDGRWTGRDPNPVAAAAAARGVAIDFRTQQRAAADYLVVVRLDAPPSAAPGESFLITAWVQSPGPRTAAVRLKRGEAVIAEGERELTAGLNRLTFRDRAGDPGSLAY